jgi:hypothetical protein
MCQISYNVLIFKGREEDTKKGKKEVKKGRQEETNPLAPCFQ